MIVALLFAAIGVFAFFVTGIGYLTIAKAEDPKLFETQNLVGTYRIVSGEMNGKAVPEAELKGMLVSITQDSIEGTDKETKKFFSVGYILNQKTNPVQIQMVTKDPKAGTKSTGIIEMTGTSVRICYPIEGGEIPKEFKTKEKQHLFELKLVKQ